MSLTPKQQLEQVNNPNLLSILSTIQGLPLSNEDVTSEVETQVPLVTQILEGLVGKAQGANATADKILEGYSAYVGQELIEGTAKDASRMADLLSMTGYTKMAVDKFTFSVDTEVYNTQLSHSLGEIPFTFLLIANNSVSEGLISTSDCYLSFVVDKIMIGSDWFCRGGGVCLNYQSSTQVDGNNAVISYTTCNSVINSSKPTSDTIFVPAHYKETNSTKIKFRAGIEYTLITMA